LLKRSLLAERSAGGGNFLVLSGTLIGRQGRADLLDQPLRSAPQDGGALPLALGCGQASPRVQRFAGEPPAPQLPQEGSPFQKSGPRAGVVALPAAQNRQAVEHIGDAPAVTDLPPDGQALLKKPAGGEMVTLLLGYKAQAIERDGDAPPIADLS